jgi:hypothetical protein
MTIAARNLFSTGTRTDTGYVVAWDITIPVAIAERLLPRFANGGPHIRITTAMNHYNLQIADIVTITTSRYKALNYNGLTTTTKWEVIGKEVDIDGDSPRIVFDLVFAYQDTPPSSVRTRTQRFRPNFNLVDQIKEANISEEVLNNHVITGLGMSTTGGFGADLGHGVITGMLGRKVFEDDVPIVVDTSRDTYVYYDYASSVIVKLDTALGAGQPTTPTGMTPLWKLVSDGSSITGTTDLRITKALNGAKLVDSSVDTLQITDDAIDRDKLGADAVRATHINPERLLNNRILNGLFDQFIDGGGLPPDGWAMSLGVWDTDVSRDSSNSMEGRYALEFLAASSIAILLKGNSTQVREGYPYRASAFFKGSGNADVALRMQWKERDNSTVVSTLSTGTIKSPTVNEKVELISTPPADARWVQPHIGRNATAEQVFAGGLTIQRVPFAFSAHHTSTQDIAASTTATVSFSSVQINQGSAFSGNQFTAHASFGLSGVLMWLKARVVLQGPTANETYFISIYNNGVKELDGTRWVMAGGDGGATLEVSGLVRVLGGNAVDIRIFNGEAAVKTLDGGLPKAYFQGHEIGPDAI